MLQALAAFLGHPLGLSVIAFAAVFAGLLAGWLDSRKSDWTRARLILAATFPLPLILALLTLALVLIEPWADPLITAVLLTVGLFGVVFSLLAGAVAAWLVTAGLRR